MKIISVNIGLPKSVEWKGKTVKTAIFKHSTDKALTVRPENIDGDGQAELDVHGGIEKAVYAYASEHYPYWENFLQKPLELGIFGENLTTMGLLDQDVRIGDEYRCGTALLMVTQPRMPCYKLGLRFNDAQMTKHFFNARKNGIYFKVLEEGILQKGDTITLAKQSIYDVTIQEIVDNYVYKNKDMEKIDQILQVPILPRWFHSEFSKMLR